MPEDELLELREAARQEVRELATRTSVLFDAVSALSTDAVLLLQRDTPDGPFSTVQMNAHAQRYRDYFRGDIRVEVAPEPNAARSLHLPPGMEAAMEEWALDQPARPGVTIPDVPVRRGDFFARKGLSVALIYCSEPSFEMTQRTYQLDDEKGLHALEIRIRGQRVNANEWVCMFTLPSEVLDDAPG